MWQDKVVIGHGKPELFFEPNDFFGKAICPARETAIALALGQVVPLNKTGVDCVAHGGICQLFRNGFRFSKDYFSFDLRNSSVLSHFDNLSIQRIGCGPPSGQWTPA